MLLTSFSGKDFEAGCDEAGRGCLAGPVFAAAVIFPLNYYNPEINDSKKLKPSKRSELCSIIQRDALSWAVASANNIEIDNINILQASFLAMHRAIAKLNIRPDLLLIDGNRFKAFQDIQHYCIIKGDTKYQSIAAASILAKTKRDEFMELQHNIHSAYDWKTNKGYPTKKHKNALLTYGYSPLHRLTFKSSIQLKIDI